MLRKDARVVCMLPFVTARHNLDLSPGDADRGQSALTNDA
jgi:hypothetical protein